MLNSSNLPQVRYLIYLKKGGREWWTTSKKKEREKRKRWKQPEQVKWQAKKKNGKVDFTVAFSGQGETMEENIHQKSTRKSKETYWSW